MQYLYALMDDETRFWIAQQVADTKYTANINPLLNNPKTRHIKHIRLQGDHNNNKMERFNGEVKLPSYIV